jgi:4-hydroxythreonine-4-phosphate dehydrogenase
MRAPRSSPTGWCCSSEHFRFRVEADLQVGLEDLPQAGLKAGLYDVESDVVTVKPRIAITVGDPAGIGPEIARKAAADRRVIDACEPILYGPPPEPAFETGVLSAAAGRAAYDAICAAVRDAQAGIVDAIATAPVNKLAFSRAGLPWKGHTDLLAHLTGTTRAAMMFWSEPLKVVLATVHVPLADVPRLLTADLVGATIDLTAREMPRFGIRAPRLALAGLNPHAGEEGLLGSEDDRVLRPAVAAARARGVDISGPHPGDTIFVRASRGEFDVVIACYHDQGLIPVKLLAFGESVNVTLGLPIVRTSVDHGTAFDIAGKNVADPSSMIAATLLAARLATAVR